MEYKSNPKDPQQFLLYAWENSFVENAKVTYSYLDSPVPMDAARRLIARIAKDYGIAAPKVRKHRYKDFGSCYFSPRTYSIVVAENWGLVGHVLVHEMAKLGIMVFNAPSDASHGLKN
jgi:hypothetical protein